MSAFLESLLKSCQMNKYKTAKLLLGGRKGCWGSLISC